jgi:hypothetical protein
MPFFTELAYNPFVIKIPSIRSHASPPPRMLGTAKMAPYLCKKVRMDALKKGSIEMLKPP